VPLLWENVFNSDQAIIGLMAKHLSEGKAFPLFFYGQNYMLGVQAWIAVPFFWIGGPTVTMLRLPLVLVNVGVVAALIVMLTRRGMRPALALVAALPLIVPSPMVAEGLLETIGASIEPFAYVLLLFALRRRPVWFGALFCFAVLHREFVVFAAPALLVAQWRERRWWTLKDLARGLAAFGAVWIVIDLLKRTVNAYGPSGGDRMSASLALQAQQIFMWLSAEPGPYIARVGSAVMRGLPDMHGARVYPLSEYGIAGGIAVGSVLAGAALALALAIGIARLIVSAWRGRMGAPAEALTPYLAVIGVLAVAAYGLNSGTDPAHPPIVRYLLFALLLPVAALAAFFFREPRRQLRIVVAALVCVWAVFTTVDNARLLRAYVVSPPPHPHREVADYLVEHRMRFGRAGYWDAYAVTFLARERVILASTQKVRISAYQASVEENAWHAVTLRRQPCDTGTRVAAWCIEDPFERHRR